MLQQVEAFNPPTSGPQCKDEPDSGGKPPFSCASLRVLYNSVTHILCITCLQANHVLSVDRQRTFKRVFFHLMLPNIVNSPTYQTTVKPYADVIHLNENFYFPNIHKSNLKKMSIHMSLYGCCGPTDGTDQQVDKSKKILLSEAYYPVKRKMQTYTNTNSSNKQN